MKRSEYIEHRNEKATAFMDTIKQGLGSNMSDKELQTMEFGFKKGMDTATEGGTSV